MYGGKTDFCHEPRKSQKLWQEKKERKRANSGKFNLKPHVVQIPAKNETEKYLQDQKLKAAFNSNEKG